MKWVQIIFPGRHNIFIWINLFLMVAGLFLLQWRPEAVILAYFLETIIIGIIHIVKLYTVWKYGHMENGGTIPRNPNMLYGGGAILFFTFHYFFFVFVQSVFIFFFMKKLFPGLSNDFNVIGNYYRLLADPDVLMVFLALAFSNIAIALKNFFLPGNYHHTTLQKLFMQPYLRIFIQQFVAIMAGFFIIFNGGTYLAVGFLIVLRLLTDLYLNAAMHSGSIKKSLLNRLTKGQKKEDAATTKDQLESFLNN